jgi:adenylate kinase
MNIILFGPPGAGKDTLADQLKLRFTMISTGKIFREAAENKTKLGMLAKNKYWSKGILCPDNITNSIIEEAIAKNPNNLLFNGYPRSVNQAEFLDSLLKIDLVLDLNVTEHIAVKRLLGRGRSDDKEDIIKKRFNEYKEKTLPVSTFYGAREDINYIFLNANRTPEEVLNESLEYINHF